MKERGCFGNLFYLAVMFVAFAFSSYFWFTFFVRGRSVPTPNLSGKSVPEARAVVSDNGLVMVVDNSLDRHSEKATVGAVVWQNRSPGSLIKRGTRIYVGQSLGPLILRVPDLTGQSSRTALLRLSQRNLRLGNLSYVDGVEKQGIVAVDPPTGTVVKGQTGISLLVGLPRKDAELFVMPDLIDQPLDEARRIFSSRGLSIMNVKYESYPGVSEGTILQQYPLNGSPVSSGDSVTVVVSKLEPALGEGAFPQ